MKLKNKYITSIEALRSNFNFIEVWNKLNILIRDLSPKKIPYTEPNDIHLFEAIANPKKVQIVNSCISIAENHTVNLNDNELKLLNDSKLKRSDFIQIVCLARLAQSVIPQDVEKLFAPLVVNDSSDYIELTMGESIPLKQIDFRDGIKLVEKLIKVPNNAQLSCTVGNVELHPGQYTYGVFCENQLVSVSPREGKNASFRLEYKFEDNNPILVVTDRTTNLVVSKFRRAHYFVLLGDNNFAVIDGVSVISKTDEDLNNRLRRIERSFCPMVLQCNKKILTIIYQTGRKEQFILNQ